MKNKIKTMKTLQEYTHTHTHTHTGILKDRKAITLIALVITIVILLILSGITIFTLTGENGLFIRAKQAKEESMYANAAEKVKLAVNASYDETANLNKEFLKENLNKIDGIYPKVKEITYDLSVTVDGYQFIITELGQVTAVGRTETLPDNKSDTNAGTEVKLKDEWVTQTVRYIKTSDGTEATGLETIATVYAVSDGKGNSVPVPYGFFYVGGNLDTGVIISDNEADKYDGKTDKTTHEYSAQLKGNQFVWIPCEKSNYKKYNWGSNYYNTTWDMNTNSAEEIQVEKYGGFYIARYEAGLGEAKFSGIEIGNTSDRSAYIYSKASEDSKPTSKANEIVWQLANYDTAYIMSKKMYNTKFVASGLATGTQYDVMLNYISDEENKSIENASKPEYYKDLKENSTWGNYNNTSLTNCRGKYSINNYYWTENLTGTNAPNVVLTSGASEQTKKRNLYDVAGNLWEWTDEYIGGTSYSLRGGATYWNNNAYPPCYRYGYEKSNLDANIGFRVAIYIK